MKKVLFFAITFLLSSTSFSQSYYALIHFRQNKVTPFYSEASKAKVKLYLNNDWQEGSMILKDSTFISPATFRYDALNDRMEIRMIVDPQNLDKVVFGGKFFIYSDFYFNEEKRSGYFQLLNEGKAMLLKRRYVNLFPGKEGALGHKSFNAVGYATFIKVGNQTAIPLKSPSEEIIKLFSDKESRVADFILKNNINVKKKKALMHLIKYYNTLK